jgi:integrase
VKLADLNGMKVSTWMNQLTQEGKTPDIRFKALKTLRACFQNAVRVEQIKTNPGKSIRLPKLKKSKPSYLSEEEVYRLLRSASGNRMEAFYYLAIDSGCRMGELLALHWTDIDFKEGTIRIVKTLEELKGKHRLKDTLKTEGSERIVPITATTIAKLEEHRTRVESEGWDVKTGMIFVNTHGGFMWRTNFREFFHELCDKANVDRIPIYDLRHTCATLLLSKGVNIKVVSERLGHSDIAITLRHYAFAIPKMHQEALNAIQQVFLDSFPQNPPNQETQTPFDSCCL